MPTPGYRDAGRFAGRRGSVLRFCCWERWAKNSGSGKCRSNPREFVFRKHFSLKNDCPYNFVAKPIPKRRRLLDKIWDRASVLYDLADAAWLLHPLRHSLSLAHDLRLMCDVGTGTASSVTPIISVRRLN